MFFHFWAFPPLFCSSLVFAQINSTVYTNGTDVISSLFVYLLYQSIQKGELTHRLVAFCHILKTEQSLGLRVLLSSAFHY